jgi:lysophospholipase L1-like esterase
MRVCVNTVFINSYGFQIEYDEITHWNPYTRHDVVNADNLKNKLYGKRLLICGDSITYGYNADERNAYVPTLGTYVNVLSPDNSNWRENTVLKKTFGYYIGERNAMTVAINAVSGSTMAENANSAQDGYAPAPFSRTNTTAGQNRYVDAIAGGADYCLLWFGANDSAYYANGKIVIGTSADTTNKSEWGAWNLVLNYYRTNYPNTKIGIIVPWCTEQSIRDCIRAVAKYWGIPVLDWMGDTQVPLVTAYGRDGQTVNADLLTTIENTWYHGPASNDKMHPNDVGYQQISTVIEQFLMTL